MGLLWDEVRGAIPLIVHGDPTLLDVVGVTLQVAAVAAGAATLIGVPLGIAIALGRFRGRGALQLAANAGLGLPPALVGAVLFLLFANRSVLGSLHLIFTRRAVFVAQTILALPFTVALTAAAVQALAAGVIAQARLLGASRPQLGLLALREARIGVLAAVIAALGSALSEVAAIAIVGGNIYGYDQTLASSTLYYVNGARYEQAVAVAIVLAALILVLMGGLGLLQQRAGVRLRFRPAT
jgi:tungstate transport system permease protein